ncbi:hypothetical protein Cni_G20080 [Canna indica]|uniref:Uncharacterized protein n=1 Tax=Canna indica TaxID=4628 RepID=A0AAQ3KQP5_9LILI|nr:hypothetical protein Cni_G20080 [Canna indica]
MSYPFTAVSSTSASPHVSNFYQQQIFVPFKTFPLYYPPQQVVMPYPFPAVHCYALLGHLLEGSTSSINHSINHATTQSTSEKYELSLSTRKENFQHVSLSSLVVHKNPNQNIQLETSTNVQDRCFRMKQTQMMAEIDFDSKDQRTNSKRKRTSNQTTNNVVHYLGKPNRICEYCLSLNWFEERIKKTFRKNRDRFFICCQQGIIKLPTIRITPQHLHKLLNPFGDVESKKFRKNIRLYNSMFSFVSRGAKIDNVINTKPGPYVFKICGQTHHRIRSLLLREGERPKFA